MNPIGMLVGRRLANREAHGRKIGAIAGIRAVGLDGLGSLRRQWRKHVERPARSAGMRAPRLIISALRYRNFAGRLLKIVSHIGAQHPRRPVLVVIPEVAKEHWWDYLLLDSSRNRKLRTALLHSGGPNLAVVTVPWAREEPHPEKVIEEERHDPKHQQRPSQSTSDPVEVAAFRSNNAY